jgi:competence protein ComEC
LLKGQSVHQTAALPAHASLPSGSGSSADPAKGDRDSLRRAGIKLDQPARFVIAPLAPVVAAMAVGIMTDRWFLPLETGTWVWIALALGALATLTVRRLFASCIGILAAFCAIGGGWHHHRWSDLAGDDLAWSITEAPRPAWVRGVISEARGIRHRKEGFGFAKNDEEKVTTRFVLDLTAVSDGERWHAASGRTVAVVTGDRSEIRAGQAVEAAGQIARVGPPLNPGEFDYRVFLQAQGIRLRLAVDDRESFWLDPNGTSWPFTYWLDNLRHVSRERLFERLDESTAPLASALLLGWREEIDPEVNDAFARTGTTHLLAISGLQLQALALALLVVFRVAGFPRRPAYLIVGLTMIGYGMLVGPAPSVVRSTVMTATFCLAAIAQRRARSSNTLSLAALSTLAINPMYLFDVGCQLSFLAIATLVWLVSPACALVRRIHERIRDRIFASRPALDDLERQFEPWWRTALRRATASLMDGVIASTVVWLAALPLVAFRFHLVSPIGIILNMPLIPLTSAALLLGGLSLLLSLAWSPLGAPLAWATAGLLKLSQAIVLWGVTRPWGHRFVVGPSWGWVLVFYAVLGLAAVMMTMTARPQIRMGAGWLRSRGVWLLLVGLMLPGWLLSGVTTGSAALEAEFLAVGHGLTVLLRTPDGQTSLYDCGRLGDPSVGRRIIAPALWARGVSRIDTVFLSHADQDHYDGLPDLIDRFAIGEVRLPPGFAGADNPMAIALIEQLRARGIPRKPITAPESWVSAGVRFAVLHPTDGWHPEASDNARSLVLDIAFAGRHLLLTGDLELLGLEELIERPPPEPPPDVLLAPHHGGRAANPSRFYDWAKPRLVVVSQRPQSANTSDALAPLERRGIPLLRTWRDGAIRLQWTHGGISVHRFSNDQAILVQTCLVDPLTNDKRGSTTQKLLSNAVEPRVLASRVGRLIIGCIAFALGAITCLVVAVIEFGAWVLVAPPRSIVSGDFRRTDVTADDLRMVLEPIEIRAVDGARLAGRWLPAPRLTGRTALLLHGFAEASSQLEARRATALNRHGWNVTILDSRGYGLSDGPYATFGGREAGDIRAWLDYLAERIDRIDPSARFKPVLWGRSMGAGIALRTAAAEPRLAALVLESPMVDLGVSIVKVLRRRRLPFPNLLASLIACRAGKLAGVPIHRPRPIDLAPDVTCPTLIVHGTNDTIVTLNEARRLADAFAKQPRWFEVPDARHTDVVDKGGAELLDRIAAFLDEAAGADETNAARPHDAC